MGDGDSYGADGGWCFQGADVTSPATELRCVSVCGPVLTGGGHGVR